MTNSEQRTSSTGRHLNVLRRSSCVIWRWKHGWRRRRRGERHCNVNDGHCRGHGSTRGDRWWHSGSGRGLKGRSGCWWGSAP